MIMPLSVTRSLLIIAICAICTFSERLFPFLLFGNRKVPPLIRYLGKILPMAVIATLVVYCLRHIDVASFSGFVPELLATAVTAGLHLLKRNTLLSVVGGTLTYMLLVQIVF
jgi:branched-subunit amino acid transport protein AzlD